MHDLKFIREHPDRFDAGLAKRGVPPRAGEILALDEDHRRYTKALNDLQARRNAASKEIGAAKAAGDEETFNALREEVEKAKGQMATAEAEAQKRAGEIREILAGLPNLPSDEAPLGKDEAANEELRRVGEPRALNDARQHFEIGEALGQMDFETAAKIAGARFALLSGDLARLERALANFMIDLHVGEHGYEEVSPPFLVRDETMFGTGQLPKFAEDSFQTTQGRWLIPTAEVSLTNIVRDAILSADELPRRYVAHTPCFRSEAGSAGRDTRGMIRLHQFTKVELVSITAPNASDDEHERMTTCAEAVLQRLELPYRVMALSTGDMGFSARKTYDLEVWLPGQGAYREISSLSNCGDFQARRMNARYRPGEKASPECVHTLNGSGLAVGRTLVAILENCQQANGSVAVPDALRPYMGGAEQITRAAARAAD